MSTQVVATRDKVLVQDYRVIVRHSPFRTKSRVVEGARPEEAWKAFYAILQDEHSRLTVMQKKSHGRQQSDWLAVNLTQPPDTEVILEEEFQRRIKEGKDREDASRMAIERNQKALVGMAEAQRTTTEALSMLVSQLPDALAKAVTTALAAKKQ